MKKEIIKTALEGYITGEKTLEETNVALAEVGAEFHLSAQKNVLTEAEKRSTIVGYYADQVTGYGLLDTGTGSFDKVQVVNGKLVNCDCGNMKAIVIRGYWR